MTRYAQSVDNSYNGKVAVGGREWLRIDDYPEDGSVKMKIT